MLFAMGRHADTHALNLGAAGVVAEAADGKIKCVNEVTNVPHIYAIGDVLHGQMELTPVAIKAGRCAASTNVTRKRFFSFFRVSLFIFLLFYVLRVHSSSLFDTHSALAAGCWRVACLVGSPRR